MRFYRKKRKQILDLTGDFVMTHNDVIVTGVCKSASPGHVVIGSDTHMIRGNLWQRLKITGSAISYIWGGGK